MQEQYQNWLNAIERSELTGYKKQKYSGIVFALSQTGAPVILNARHFALLVGIDYSVLKRMFYDRDKFYRTFSIKKRNGGERIIEAPYPSLKLVQRWILDCILTPTAILHPMSVGFIRGKTIVDNARPHIGNEVLLKMDIKDFFPSIPQTKVEDHFSTLGYDGNLSSILAYLCCKNNRLPQGAPTSPILSNVLNRGMDFRLSEIAYQENLCYTRYADDLSFSGNRVPIPFIEKVTQIVGTSKLRINKEKTRRSGKQSRKIITGISISSGRITIPRIVKREIRQKVYYILKYGLFNHLNHINSRDLLAGYRLLGLLAYWHSVEPDNMYVQRATIQIKRILKEHQDD